LASVIAADSLNRVGTLNLHNVSWERVPELWSGSSAEHNRDIQKAQGIVIEHGSKAQH